jgi:hypothetical protein
MVEKKRLDGALQKIEELTLSQKALAETGTTKDQTLAQRDAKIAELEAQKQAEIAKYDTMLQDLNAKYLNAQNELSKGAALQRKLKAITASGHTELLAIVDTLPAEASDEDQLKTVERFYGFAQNLVKAREKEILAGVTDGAGGTGAGNGGGTPPVPQNDDEWTKKINSLPVGSKERQAAWDAYFEATQAKLKAK